MDSLEVNPSYNLSYRKMARNRGQKATNGPKKDTKKVENSNQQSNLANGYASGTSVTMSHSKNKSSGSSSHHLAQVRMNSQKSEMQESVSNGEENESTAAPVTGDNHVESDKPELQMNADQKTSRSATKVGKSTSAAGKKYILRSLSNSVRVLRSRENKTPKALPKTESHSMETSAEQSKQKRKKHKKKTNVVQDELSRTRKRIKYLLLRIGFEQSMIDAYSSEGWKGQSQEKIRPEKELQKAASKILQCKLAIREAFHHLDSLCLEGSLQESAFDSEGQINSEDIFCSKCGSKDLVPDNDIILCDGACDRGFHQKCLEPPLETANIPPEDEGWLCPECDCKLDCYDLVNDYFGTTFELGDSWEKVFAEAVVSTAGDENPFDLEGMPSDDSEDDDYDPESPEKPDSNKQEEGSSSEEASSTSDAENSNNSSSDNEGSESGDSSEVSSENNSEHFGEHLADSGKGKSKIAKGKKCLESSELPVISDLDENGNIASSVSGKRHRQDIDYKKLHDEMFGHAASDEESMSEDDEEWGPRKRLRKGKQFDMEQDVSSKPELMQLNKVSVMKKKGKGRDVSSSEDTKLSKFNLWRKHDVKKENEECKIKKKAKHEEGDPQEDVAPSEFKASTKENISQQELLGSPPVSAKQKVLPRLPTPAIEKFRVVFGENRFPSRPIKEGLAKEFDISFKQVHKWFDNARNFARHQTRRKQAENSDGSNESASIIKDDNIKSEKARVPGSAGKSNKDTKIVPSAERGKRKGGEKHGIKDLKTPASSGEKAKRQHRRN